jgi:hypothetical protein
MFEMEVYTPLGSGTEAWGPVAIPLHPRSMEKIAGTSFTPQKLIDFMDRIRPRDDGRYVLLNAIGAYEYWSSNANADAFPEWSLKGEPPPPMVKEFIRAKGLPMPTEYGCDTFERYAYTYRYHQNQDPTLTIGERVCCAAYNDKMHRVELIVFVSNEKAPDLVQRIDAGEPIPWSMGAKLPYDLCLYPGTQIYGPDMVKNVEDVEVGDFVFTNKGRARKVVQVFRRSYTGTVVTLKVKGLVQRPTLTGNHPVFVFRKEQIRTPGGRRLNEKAADVTGAFVEASSVKPGDYVAVPRLSMDTSEYESIDVPLARLCGYYLGDGCIITQRRGEGKTGGRDYVGISVCCNADEKDHIARVVDTFEILSESKVHVYPAGEDRHAVQIVCHDQVLAARVAGMCGRLKEKHIPAEIFYSPVESRLALLGGMMDTDGCVDKKKKGSRITITINPLMEQAQILAFSVGIPATMSRNRVYSDWSPGTTINQLNLGCAGTSILKDYSTKCASVEPVVRWSATIIEHGDFFLLPVDTVIQEEAVEKPVFNLAVEEDETYHVGFIAHNCSVCMNVATNRDMYCEHLKNMKNHVLPDGQKVFSWNWFPRFFDISAVIVPADRSAYSLKKIASVGGPFVEIVESPVLAPPMAGIEKFAGILDFLSAGGTKKADIEKEVPVEEPQKNLGPSPIDPDVWKILFNRVAKDQATSETLPKEMMDLKGFSPQTILSALTSLGVILKPEEAGYLLGDQKVPADLDLKQPDPTLLGRSKGLIEKRSMFDPFFSMRTPREASIWRPTVLVKRANSYDSYKAWLSHVDLEQLKAVTSHPSVQMLLNPSLVEEKILGLEKSAGVPTFLRMVTPFVAGAGAD